MTTVKANNRRIVAVLLTVVMVFALVAGVINTGRANAVGTPSTLIGRSLPTAGKVVDVSKWNGDVNMLTMKSQGVSGVMIRASYGTEKDSKFDQNCLNAGLALLPYGAYSYATWHIRTNFAQAMIKATQEANALVAYLATKVVSGYVALDLEVNNVNNIYLNKTELTAVANYYMGILKAAGYKPMLYTSTSLLATHMNASAISYPLWLAYYYDNGSRDFPNTGYGAIMKNLKSRIVMWQYTCKGRGVQYGTSGGNVDLNYLYYSFIG